MTSKVASALADFAASPQMRRARTFMANTPDTRWQLSFRYVRSDADSLQVPGYQRDGVIQCVHQPHGETPGTLNIRTWDYKCASDFRGIPTTRARRCSMVKHTRAHDKSAG